ncbi:hypothetical protein M885DRAFT_175383 [Pelagophyceae sp. CCMP2097]|nr:hypothetical protein M885DRAFT_175383 [Pelagophyceae sp. CCMP2097]
MRRTTKLGSCIAGCLIAAVSLQSTLLSHWCVRRNAGAAAARARTGSGAAPRAAPISAAPPRSVAARLAADDADESRLERLLSRRLAAAPRYAARADGASTVECTLFGKRAPHADAADCHGEPPFTNWWHDYRTCYATNVCLREGVLSYYDGDAARPRERIGSPLACTDWRATQQGQHVVERRAGRPARASADVVWYDAPVLHGSELMGGHFGHDVAQNLLFAYSTLWHANLTAWLEPGAGVKPVHFVYDANPRRPAVLADVFDRVAYARGTPAWPKTHCFKLAMLSPLHDFGADLQWHRNSPSTEKKLVWRGYRNLLLRHACPDCAAALGKRGRLARNDRCVGNASGAVVSVFKRSHDGKTSNLLTANGRGRRITNHAAVVAALQEALPGGAVEDVDPSLMTLAKQQALMAKTDVVVTRMASQVQIARARATLPRHDSV